MKTVRRSARREIGAKVSHPLGHVVRSGVMPDFQQDPDGIWRDGFLLDLLSRELS
jgi:hypothetical protein